MPKKYGDWDVSVGHPKSGETPNKGILTEIKCFCTEESENMVKVNILNKSNSILKISKIY